MPRGLMIKRRKGVSVVSYRVRTEEQQEPGLSSLFPGTLPPRTQTPLVPLWTPSRPAPVQFGNPEAVHVLHSPTRPVSREHERRFSPVTPECWATHAALPEPESGLARQITSTRTDPGARRKTPVRRLQVRDDVTTSPVLGLKIKEAPPERRAPAALVGLVCQLCREAFPEPLALAQHRCSRIVRVEYRCDCGKAFGCSANLASHRRWHRPHSDSDSAEDAAHECAHCGKRFKRLASLRKHEARHEEAAPINLSHRAAANKCHIKSLFFYPEHDHFS
uniref:INSM transcriptional repressor 1 n=1 Tax=Neogobius melanostomus TaxID=47308 RepID=A0A8C6T7Q5_9GOBI